ncbi:MAG: DEAD/DEAH box helicase, partial [Chitinophagaceae bacterium]|nr:DEAD/DEAH box helicase [Oligoflexus sp.]
GELYFRYEDVDASVVSSSLFLKDEVNQRIIHRDKAAEEQWIQTISAVPKITLIESGVLYVFAHDFADIIALLVGVGCAVYLDKRPLSVATPQIEFTSGLDWLELKCSFGEEEIDLAALLRSFQNAASLVTLSDGSVHVLDPKIRKSLERLARHLNKDDEKFVLNKQKIPLLDQILHGMPEQSIPDAVAAYRVALSSSQKRQISPRASFKGTLRPYQLEGFNWLEYMTKLSFGVCLADEMGLGKTIQILALLETRRKASEVSLIVMPRSLVGNWRSEIEKFTPGLKILNFSESKRDKVDFSKWDIVLTTYGVLLKDQELLSATQWQHVILDEAQAIKNHNSQTARAARCLSSRYRVALSGTPIENSTSDLLSLFSFLNPGMLGDTTSEVLRQHTREPEDLKVLAKSLRPLMLGRKKEDVAQDLPAKVVNILYCEMDKSQKKIYADVIRFYKGKIAEKVEATSFNKSKLLMIEAMLRLRQIACHPSLVDTSHASASSAKIEVLMEKLEELEGTPDKVLVFSQFTSFLRIIENRLTKAKITYEYLDGKTKNRSEKVDNFQNNPEIKVFLISLKAGGVGLNLTAARYTFIMDPWWNPAIEEQAMARAHRIGQTQQVIVYKMVVKDSIEEKILELQSQKEDLVKTFMDGGEENLMRKLSPEDLELLMS